MTPWWCPDGLNSFSLSAPMIETKLGNADLGCLKNASFSLNGSFLVDLDPDQQFVSVLFGDNTITIGNDASSHPALTARLADDFPLIAQWTESQRPRPTPQPIAHTTPRRAAQLVASLENVKWSASVVACSPALRRLHDEWHRTSGVLAVRLAMDNFDNNNQSATYGQGDVGVQLGTGESATHVQPTRVAASLAPSLVGPQLSFELDSALLQLRVDLGVAVANVEPGGDSVVQQLRFGVARTPGAIEWFSAGLVNVTRAALHQTNSVVVVPLSHAELQALLNAPLVVGTANRSSIVAQENHSGRVLRAYPSVVRLRTSNATQSITVKTYEFGRPVAEQVVANIVHSPMRARHDRINNSPFNGVHLPSSKFRTNATGVTVLPLSTHPIALHRLPLVRRPLRSQVYFHQLCPANQPATEASCTTLSTKIWAEPPKLNGTITWNDVGPLFKQYAWLYPSMNAMVDMSNPKGLARSAQGVAALMAFDFYAKLFMPVTRDLDSISQQRMIDFAKSLINKH